MDSFEKYIRDNRREMDIHEPDPSLWGKIETGLPAKHTGLWQYMWRAAVIILVAGFGFALIYRSSAPALREDKVAMNIVHETEQYYNSLLQSLYSEAEPMFTANPEVRSELSTGMNELDSICINIRKDLKDNVATAEVVEALICNYRLRIELLEDMLRIMNEEDSEDKNKTDYEL